MGRMATPLRALPCTVLLLLVGAAPALGLTACGQREDPAVLRYDGLYRSDPRVSGRVRFSRYLRFYEDGAVLSASFAGEPHEVLTWLHVPFENHGRYVLEGTSLRFSCTSPRGSVDCQGEVLHDGLRLTWHSHVNGQDGETRYQFVELPEAPDR